MDGDGEFPCIEQLVDQYLGALYRYGYRLCGSSTDAEDLVQETFLIAHKKLHQLRDGRAALAWLMRILRHSWVQAGKRAMRIESVPVDEIAAASDEPIRDVADVDPARLHAVLAQLPDEFREPLILFYFDELRYRDIAEVLGCPIGTVMSRLARAKAYLRLCLSPDRAAVVRRMNSQPTEMGSGLDFAAGVPPTEIG